MEVAVYRGESEIARVEARETDVKRCAVSYSCVDCEGDGRWNGHPKGPVPCVPCSTRGTVMASL